MKRMIYPFISLSKSLSILLLVTLLVCGVTSKAQIFTMFNPATQPIGGAGFTASTNDNDPAVGIELGVRFRVTQPGTISAVRFYRGSAADNQIYTGNLWDIATSTVTPVASGTLTISGSPAAGWQAITLSSSFHVVPNRTYVASYHSPNGNYSVSDNPSTDVYDDQDITRLPFVLLGFTTSAADPANPGNGVYLYTTASAYPSNSATGSNYWADILFTTDNLLPAALSDLKATTSNSDVLVSWKTSSETNNKGFEVQRSNNGTDWYAVNFINGAGESTNIKKYNYTDKGLAPGLYYYRLRQEDFDGKSKLSAVVTANISGRGTASLFANYPNPFSATSTIRFDLPHDQKIRLSIFDMSGREVRVLADKMSEAGSHQFTLNAAGLRPQPYLVRLKTENAVLTQKILVE